MSVRLVGEVVEWLLSPAADGMTPAERAVLLVIAERAHDQTREMWRHRGDHLNLHDRIAIAIGAPDGLKKVLRRLADRGLEVRIPISVNKVGKPVFATNGRPARFRLPQLPPSVKLPERRDERAPFVAENAVDNPVAETLKRDPEGPLQESQGDREGPLYDGSRTERAPFEAGRGDERAPLITSKSFTSKTSPSIPGVPSRGAEVEGGPVDRREPPAKDRPPTYRQPPLMVAVPSADTEYDTARTELATLGPEALDAWIAKAHGELDADATGRQIVIHAHQLATGKKSA